MVTKKYTLTDEHRAQLKPWADKWIRNAMSTQSMTDGDRRVCVDAVGRLYAAAGLKAPRVVFVSSPLVGVFATGFSAWIWHMRSTRAATYAATYDATYAATDAATRAATDDATDDATYAATRDATDDATRDATDAATDVATDVATRDADPVARFLLLCCRNWSWTWQGGNYWSGYTAYLTFFRHIAKLELDYSKFEHFEVLAEFGPRFVHKHFCIISELPDFIHRDAQARPHCETGPFTRWRDGRELYYWHGRQVPREWIVDRDKLEPSMAVTWRNIEERRVLAEIIGWSRVLEHLGARVIDENSNPQLGTLLECDLPNAEGETERERFLKVQCATGRSFVLPVPREVKTAHEANAWTFGLTTNTYNPDMRT